MLKKFLNKTKYNYEGLLEELLKKDFDEKVLDDILSSGKVDINKINDAGDTLLHICLKKAKYKSAFWLIQHNIKSNVVNNADQTPFEIAVDQDNHDIVKILLKINPDIDINKKDKYGRIILQDVVVLGKNEMAQVLISHGADINSTDMHNRNVIFDALSFGNQNFINYLLTNENLELNNVDSEQNTIMHHTQVAQNDEIAAQLIEKGADVTALNKEGRSFLCDTVLRGMEAADLIDKAIEQGANIDSRVTDNKTIFMELMTVALKTEKKDRDKKDSLMQMSKKLLLNGIDINAINDFGETVLFRAVRVGDYELSEYLLSSGVNPNIINNEGDTILSEMVLYGTKKLDVILLLLKYNAKTTIKNKNNKTIFEVLNDIILHYHGKKNLDDNKLLVHTEKDGRYILLLQEILKHNKEDLNILDSSNEPLFFKPLLYDHLHLFKLYVKHGVNIKIKNAAGHNLFYAYVYKVFEDDMLYNDFEGNLSMLMSARIDHNIQDNTGYTVAHKVMHTNCNIELLKSLVKVTRFDYSLQDLQGRTVMHTAVWFNQQIAIKIINYVNPKVASIADNYGILPITYAALLGNQKLVLLFIKLKANVKSNITIPNDIITKFSPMLKNLDKLENNIEDLSTLQQIRMVIDQVKRDFKVI